MNDAGEKRGGGGRRGRGGGRRGGGGCHRRGCSSEAQILCNSSSRRKSSFAAMSLHHNPSSGCCRFSGQQAGGQQLSEAGGDGQRRHHQRQQQQPEKKRRMMPAGGGGEGQAPPRVAPPQPSPHPGRPLLSASLPSARPSVGTLRWDEVPDDFVECFILSGYRRLHCSAQECLASVLQPTNETLNFWTHFIPLLLFVGKFCRLLVLREAGDLPFHHPALLPLWCYASGVLLTFAMSCTAHVFSCLSLRLRAAFFYLDYASISYYGFASTVAYHYYLLPKLSLLQPRMLSRYLQQRLGWHVDCSAPIAAYSALVLPVAFALAVACTVACCKSRSEWCAYPFAIRTFVFVMPLSMACPIMLESLLFDLQDHNPTLFLHFYRRYFWLLVAAFFNISKIPERIHPGLFDIIGHSHQLFHIFTFLSIYDQMFYVEEGLRHFLQSPPPTSPTFAGTIGYMLGLILCLALVIRRFLNDQEVCKQE
ncbi:membrane progestin receptor epsilon [Pituophis catenifer annectens]|uniref:membrane progestin receptor epsilon n=1 Tax=Pituophis catenifer annectens TaxID=94852 RepID=UPI003995219F